MIRIEALSGVSTLEALVSTAEFVEFQSSGTVQG